MKLLNRGIFFFSRYFIRCCSWFFRWYYKRKNIRLTQNTLIGRSVLCIYTSFSLLLLMAATGRYALKRIILGIVSFFLSFTLRFRMRLVGFFHNGKVSVLISLVLVLINIILELSPLEIRSSCLFIYSLSVSESSPPVSTRMALILINIIY